MAQLKGCGSMNGMTAVIKPTPNTLFENISNYNDPDCLPATRQAKWQLRVDGSVAWDSGYVALTTAVALGTGSTGASIITPGGVNDITTFLTGLGVQTTSLSNIKLSLQVKSTCTGETSAFVDYVVRAGIDYQKVAEGHNLPVVNPHMAYFSDSVAFAAGVPMYRKYTLAILNAYDASEGGQERLLIDP
jgi:hypothetical protein